MTKTALDVFEKSYSEALAALKHQDDKLNRTLTALAFLTAAGVAIFVNLDKPPNAPVRFDGTGPSVGAVLFVVFLSSVAVALLSALSAIGPSAPLASTRKARTSLLFYPLIARTEWDDMRDKNDAELVQELTDNYHQEARDIAYRVRYKVARARESGAFVQLAIVALTLLGIFEAHGLSMTTRWWIAFAFVTVVLLSQFVELIQMIRERHSGANWGSAYWCLAIAVVLVGVLFIRAQVEGHDHWEALGAALSVLLLTRLAAIASRAATFFGALAVLAAVSAFIIAGAT